MLLFTLLRNYFVCPLTKNPTIYPGSHVFHCKNLYERFPSYLIILIKCIHWNIFTVRVGTKILLYPAAITCRNLSMYSSYNTVDVQYCITATYCTQHSVVYQYAVYCVHCIYTIKYTWLTRYLGHFIYKDALYT